MEDLEDIIKNNKVVQKIPMDGCDQTLSSDEVFQVSFSLICTINSFLRDIVLDQEKQKDVIKGFQKYLTVHHIYRFITTVTLKEFVSFKDK